MAWRTSITRQATFGVALVMYLSPAWVSAEDAGSAATGPEVVRPGVEDRATPTEEDKDQGNYQGKDENKVEDKGVTESEPQKADTNVRDITTREALCLMIEAAAKANDLPLEFFARVIWQESRFQADAVGPLTRQGRRAQGIAQFMPGTASERRLLDPFDPVQALPKSAEFLNELRNQFGNLGLAAAAYNAGPRRVQEWLTGSGHMPQETRNYVAAITGSSVDEWAKSGRSDSQPQRVPNFGCRDLMALLKRAPNPFITGLEQHVKLGADRPWGVQLAAGFDREAALAMYARAMKRLSAVIGDRDPTLLGSIWRSRGTKTFYQVRIGTDTRPAADDLCNRIRRAGGACLVLRNMNARG
jgi:hypothetical protein